ncbi:MULTISPECIES: hypothetical protein [unclassified Oceanobacter]|jgi:hypothetical protein|nr:MULTISPECIES: hypothetical protein [unclassified Oceanobacter]MDO6682717.1 hypothetical protein [Oceanobacter sp. 5_MG-2023]MDP2549135.1 hypothetical protein [Oceanobacter sp. 4_MG-2023]
MSLLTPEKFHPYWQIIRAAELIQQQQTMQTALAHQNDTHYHFSP